jgi:hypothetical protein
MAGLSDEAPSGFGFSAYSPRWIVIDKNVAEPMPPRGVLRQLFLSLRGIQNGIFILRRSSSSSLTGEVFVAGFGDEFPVVGPQH